MTALSKLAVEIAEAVLRAGGETNATMKAPIPLLGPEIFDGIEEKGLSTDIFTGWHSTDPFFKEVIRRAGLTAEDNVIEAGSWKGGSAIHMAGLCPARIFCVDHWLGGCDHVTAECAFRQGVQRDRHGWPGIYYQFLHNVKVSGYASRVVPVPMVTTDGAALLLAHKIRAKLIYIDADHTEAGAAGDIVAFRPLLAPGGIMFGDDYYLPGVQRAVARTLPFQTPIIDPTGNFWAFQFP